MLDVRSLRKTYGSRPILRDLSFHVAPGEVVALLGPSGSGKTTLLRCLNLLEQADGGSLVFDGEEIPLGHVSARVATHIRRRTAFVFQQYNLFANRTALANVAEGLVVARGFSRTAACEAARKALVRVGLGDRLDSYPSALSGGQQQRVGIARAIVTDPRIVYLDEPTSALDPESAAEVLSLLGELAHEGRTMILATHQIAFAREIATQAIFLEGGALLEAGPAASFFSDPREDRTRAFLGKEAARGLSRARRSIVKVSAPL